MTVEKPKPKQLLRPITTGANSSMNQSQFLAITCNAPEAREISRVHGAFGFGFASHWLKNWRESFKPITKRSNRNHVITFDSHLKTALCIGNGILSSQKNIFLTAPCPHACPTQETQQDATLLFRFPITNSLWRTTGSLDLSCSSFRPLFLLVANKLLFCLYAN